MEPDCGQAIAGSQQADRELVERYRATGDDAAYRELVRRCWAGTVAALVALVGDRELAEELAQRTFTRAALSIAQLREPRAFRAWLARIARAVAFDELKAPWVRRRVASEYVPEAAVASAVETRFAVHEALGALDAEDRDVLILCDLQGGSMRELARALDIGTSAAKMRLARARTRFRKAFDPR
jgi:RNA polymerase sigma-70 factor (ECF subfamily)